ncbi:MAG: DUF4350 domain-containing protein [Actinomycetota bacterium]|nr:DUF4350 domain-containing protein [Actinomycetota bacterium]
MTAIAGTSPGASVSRGQGGRRGRHVPLLILVIIAGAAIWVSASGSGGGNPLDPASTASGGAKALDLFVGRLGGNVDTSGRLPAANRGVALILVDRLSATSRRGVDAWVRAGGTLVIADPTSDLAGVAPAEGPSPNAGVSSVGALSPDCSAPWVAGVGQIDVGSVALLAAPSGATATCFDEGLGFFAIERTVGEGTVVSLAGPGLWTNGHLGADDNSVLAADLLVPQPGDTVAWLTGPVVGGGRQSLIALLPARVDEMLIGGVIATVVVGAWRSRRLGRPVNEEVPVVIPGSELVGAISRLLARNNQRQHAAELLRDELRHEVIMRMAVSPSMAPEVVAEMVANRTGRDAAAIQATLYGSAPAGDGELVDLARAVEEIRQEVRGVRS